MSLHSRLGRKVLVGTLILVLIISVGLNLYDHLIVLPQMQATINDMRVRALHAWLSKMGLARNSLKQAKTNFGVNGARVHTSWAKQLVDILTNGIAFWENGEELYYWISKATYYLHEAVFRIYLGNQTGTVTVRYLEQNVLTMIENVTLNIGSLESKIIPSFSGFYKDSYHEPTRQLREADVLTDVLNHLEQIYQVSSVILNYYR